MDRITIINPYIHQDAKLKKDKFLERIRNIQNLRTSDFSCDYLVGTSSQWDFFRELHEAINKGIVNFSFTTSKIFAFRINKDLNEWFKNNDLETIQKQIINWNAAVYSSIPESREYFETEIYGALFSEIKNIATKYYRGTLTENTYNDASLDYINCLPPKFLKNPITSRVIFNQWGPMVAPTLTIELGYLNISDWILIVERDQRQFREMHKNEIEKRVMTEADIERIFKNAETDSLQRAESNKEIFDEWIYAFKDFDRTQRHIFGLFDNEQTIGLIYLVRQRNTNKFKIGWTEKKDGQTLKESVESRVAALQTGNADPIDIVGYFRASSIRTEKAIHEKFNDVRLTGEWFRLTDNDCENILSDDWRVSNNIF